MTHSFKSHLNFTEGHSGSSENGIIRKRNLVALKEKEEEKNISHFNEVKKVSFQ